MDTKRFDAQAGLTPPPPLDVKSLNEQNQVQRKQFFLILGDGLIGDPKVSLV